MKKRVISVLLTLVMLIGLMPGMVLTAAASESVTYMALDGWTATYPSNVTEDGTDNIAKVATGFAYSGDKSLYVKYTNTASDTRLVIKNDAWPTTKTTGAKYKVSFYANGTMETTTKADGSTLVGVPFWVQVGWKWHKNAMEMNNDKDRTVTKAEGAKGDEGWYKYEFIIDSISDASYLDSTPFQLSFGGKVDMFIDDIAIAQQTAGLETPEDNTDDVYTEVSLYNAGFDWYEVPESVTYSNLESWTVARDAAIGVGGVGSSAQTATGISYSGDKSLHVKLNNTVNDKNMYLVNDAWTDVKTEATKYHVSFYARGSMQATDYAAHPMWVQVGWKFDQNLIKMNDLTRTTITYAPGEKGKEGWKKYEFIIDATTNTASMALRFSFMGICDLYIDDITVVADGDTTNTNLITNGGFEDKKISVTYSDLEYWTATYPSNVTEDGTDNIAKVATGFAYSGDKSLYVKYTNTASDTRLVIKNDAWPTTKTTGAKYKVSFYANGTMETTTKADGSTLVGVPFWVQVGWKWHKNAMEMNNDKDRTVTKAEGAKGDEGWYKYEFIIDSISDASYLDSTPFQLSFGGKVDMFIDDIVVTVENSESNLMYNSGFDGVEPVESEKCVINSDLEGWTASFNNADVPNDGVNSYVKTANGVSYSGNRSLHVKYQHDRTTEANQGKTLNILNSTFASGDANEDYQVSFYLKGDWTGEANAFYVQNGFNYSSNASVRNAWKITEMTESLPENLNKAAEGWKKYSFTINNAKTGNDGTTIYDGAMFQITLQITGEFYLDDMTVVKVGDSSVTNLIGNPGFEGTAQGAYEVLGAQLFDADGVVISDVASTSNQTVTAAVCVINNSATESMDGQLIFCLYDGKVLKKAVLSAVTSISAGESAVIKSNISMPEFSEIGNLNLKAFIWESVDTMMPLDSVTIF